MKKSVKKLSLNKMTIANLNSSEMNEKVGGSGNQFCTKITFEITCGKVLNTVPIVIKQPIPRF